MKKLLMVLILGVALTVTGVASAEDYIMSPGDQLKIQVDGHPDISSAGTDANSSYIVRPDGKLDFPLIGEIDTSGKTVHMFSEELKEKLKKFILNPNISVNISKLGTTRVFVFGEIRKQGMFELTKSHRVLDALGAAGGFTVYSAKKNVFLIRNGEKESVKKLNINDYMRKGDMSQNVVLKEGDCLFLTGNQKLTLKEILTLANTAMHAVYYGKKIETM